MDVEVENLCCCRLPSLEAKLKPCSLIDLDLPKEFCCCRLDWDANAIAKCLWEKAAVRLTGIDIISNRENSFFCITAIRNSTLCYLLTVFTKSVDIKCMRIQIRWSKLNFWDLKVLNPGCLLNPKLPMYPGSSLKFVQDKKIDSRSRAEEGRV